MTQQPEGQRAWDAWLDHTLGQLRDTKLLRSQRPTLPFKSSSEALILDADLEEWASGRPHLPHSVSSLAWHSSPHHPSHTAHQQSSTASSSRGHGSLSNAATTPQPNDTPSLDRHQQHHQASAQSLRQLKLFSLNDYLGLASHPEVCEAAASAAATYGMGPRSSAVVGGTTSLHRELEEGLAQLKGTQDCLLFPTGFAANTSVVTSLASAGQVAILSDELNHASIIDGARLASRAGTALHVYRHNDMAHVEEILRGLPRGTRALIVTDSLFSMDGDFADLQALARLKQRYGALLAVDARHARVWRERRRRCRGLGCGWPG